MLNRICSEARDFFLIENYITYNKRFNIGTNIFWEAFPQLLDHHKYIVHSIFCYVLPCNNAELDKILKVYIFSIFKD